MRQNGIHSYNNPVRAHEYNEKQGFDPKRKTEMLNVTLDLLINLTPKGSSILELGAGSGLFSQKIIDTERFSKIFVTDGAEAMLEIAKNQLSVQSTIINFDKLDFTQPSWHERYSKRQISAVTSSMAIHHAEDKKAVFKEIYNVLLPGGAFVFADHMAGISPLIDDLIGMKRARIKLDSLGEDIHDEHKIDRFITNDKVKQDAEGNKCESVSQYIQYLIDAGFENVDCLWRDYWLAVFVAKKA
ncbi:class I SAM-dependent methyltransferase [Bacillus niameyensis]|uniref:class I SAM-dependent methyltransferase n=1 Tax=Bacillus niameyensis TaxID=1522308 RepID=UPI000784C26F|nr:class I SAM-dependent methyltransferase [Bacillus niameyensis]